MKTAVKFAVVGCGHIGKRHAEMISRNEFSALVALADVLPKDQLNIDHFGVPFFSSIDQLLASNPAVDVVNICTPNGLHADMAIQALNAGKHVVVEKPMALHTSDARAMIDSAERNNKHIFCVMQNRYSPPSVWLKEMIDSGRLGKIYMVDLNCFWNRDHRYYIPGNWHGNKFLDGGTLFTQFSHFVDMMYWLFGEIKNVNATFRNFNHENSIDFEDSGLIQFDFKNGALGSLNYTTSVWDKNLESCMTIIAENGSIKVGGQYMNEVLECHVKDYQMPRLDATNPGNDYGAYKGSAQNHHFVIDNVISTLQGKTRVSATAEEGLRVVEIIEQIYAQKQG